MTSNLSVSPVATPAGGSGASQPADNSSPLGAFGAMLDGIQSAISRPRGLSHSDDAQPQSSSPPQNVPAAADAGGNTATAAGAKNPKARHTGFSSAADQTDANAADPTDGTPPKLLSELVSALGDLNKAENDGGTIDDKLLKRVKDAVDAIAAYLAGQPQLANSPSAAGATDGGADTASPASTNKDAKAAAALAEARDSLSRLADKLGTLSAGLGKDQSDLAGKLDELAKQLDPKSLAKTTLTDLGLAGEDGTPPDTRLAAAINALVDGKQQSSTAGQPKLAAASLKLPDGTTLSAGDKTDEAAHHLDSKTPATTPDGQPPDVADASSKPGTETKATSETKADQTKAKDAASDLASVIKDAAQQPAATTESAPAAAAVPAAAAPPTATASATPDVRQAQSAYQTAPINLPQMAVEIAQHSQQGSNHFQIRLDPPEMGRVNVSLAIDSSGTVNAHLTVERSETLDFLKRDQANLQQALQQAGLDAGKTNLQFSLSQNPFARQDGSADSDAGNYSRSGDGDADPSDAIAAVTAATLYRGTASASGLNLIV